MLLCLFILISFASIAIASSSSASSATADVARTDASILERLPPVIWGNIGSFLGAEYAKLGTLSSRMRQLYLEHSLQHFLSYQFSLPQFRQLPSSIELSHLADMKFVDTRDALHQLITDLQRHLPLTSPVISQAVMDLANSPLFDPFQSEAYFMAKKSIPQRIEYHWSLGMKSDAKDVEVLKKIYLVAAEEEHIGGPFEHPSNINNFLMVGYVAGRVPLEELVPSLQNRYVFNEVILQFILMQAIIMKQHQLSIEEKAELERRILFALENAPHLIEKGRLAIRQLLQVRLGNFEAVTEYVAQARSPKLFSYFLIAAILDNAPAPILQSIPLDNSIVKGAEEINRILAWRDPHIRFNLRPDVVKALDLHYIHHHVPMANIREILDGSTALFAEIMGTFLQRMAFLNFFFYYAPSRLDIVANFFRSVQLGEEAEPFLLQMPEDVFLHITADPALTEAILNPRNKVVYLVPATAVATVLRSSNDFFKENFEMIGQSILVSSLDLNSVFIQADWNLLFKLAGVTPNFNVGPPTDDELFALLKSPLNYYHLLKLAQTVAPIFGKYIQFYSWDDPKLVSIFSNKLH